MINDGLPSQICSQCVQNLNEAYSFRQLCERSENIIRELLGRPVPHQTFLELKPLLTTETLITNTLTEINTNISEPFPIPNSMSETFTVTQNINSIPNSLNSGSESVVEIDKTVNNETENINTQTEIIETENFQKESDYVNDSESSCNLQENTTIDCPKNIEIEKVDPNNSKPELLMKLDYFERSKIGGSKNNTIFICNLKSLYF